MLWGLASKIGSVKQLAFLLMSYVRIFGELVVWVGWTFREDEGGLRR